VVKLVKDRRSLQEKAEIGYQIGWWLTVALLRVNPMRVIEHETQKSYKRRW